MARVGLRARKVARTRDEILRAARECFLKKGYANATLEDVAEEADLCKRTVLRYFPTKAHLVLHRQYAAYEIFKEQVMNRNGRPVLDIWEEHVSFHARSQTEAMRSSDLGVVVALDPDVGPAMFMIGSGYKEILSQELCADLGGDPATDVLSKVAAAALAIGSFSVANMVLTSDGFEDLEAAEAEVVRLVRENLLKLPPAGSQPRTNRRGDAAKAGEGAKKAKYSPA